MDIKILNIISDLLSENKELLRIPIRQKAKFEGWLKFELANRLENLGLERVEVETKAEHSKDRADISFFSKENSYKIELKTPNANWRIDGINSNGRPITKNIKSIISDAKKLNSNYGIVAFVLFPIPLNDNRWKNYIQRIKDETKIEINFNQNCRIIEMNIDDQKNCNILVCSFKSRKFDNWRI